MNTSEKQKVVKEVLPKLSQIENPPKDEKGNLDVAKFNELLQVKEGIEKLKKAGITKDWLSKKGYMVACLLLNIK